MRSFARVKATGSQAVSNGGVRCAPGRRSQSRGRMRSQWITQRRSRRRASRYARGGGAGGSIKREDRRVAPPIFKPSCAGIMPPVTVGTTPHEAKHWLAQPDAVRHCGMVRHCAMSMSQGQSGGSSPAISVCEAIAHDLAIATLATGAKASVSDTKRARMTRRELIRSYPWCFDSRLLKSVFKSTSRAVTVRMRRSRHLPLR